MKDSNQTARFHYTWEQSPYLLTRKQQLTGALGDVCIPVSARLVVKYLYCTLLSIFQEISELALLGRAPGPAAEEEIRRVDSLDSLGDSLCSDSEVELV